MTPRRRCGCACGEIILLLLLLFLLVSETQFRFHFPLACHRHNTVVEGDRGRHPELLENLKNKNVEKESREISGGGIEKMSGGRRATKCTSEYTID